MSLARRRQSTRRFADRPVPLELVEKLVTAAQEAPTSCNHQLNRYVVVTEPAVKRALREQAGVPARIEQAPVSIVLALRMGWNHNKLSVVQSLGMAAQNLLLAATSLGLKSVIQAGIGDTDAIRSVLGIGDGYFVGSIVCLGYGEDSSPRAPRLPASDVASADRFAEPRFCRTVCTVLAPA